MQHYRLVNALRRKLNAPDVYVITAQVQHGRWYALISYKQTRRWVKVQDLLNDAYIASQP